jgi:hypothetical protein
MKYRIEPSRVASLLKKSSTRDGDVDLIFFFARIYLYTKLFLLIANISTFPFGHCKYKNTKYYIYIWLHSIDIWRVVFKNKKHYYIVFL